MFQFHFGTIDRQIIQRIGILHSEFQFHFGTIDSVTVKDTTLAQDAVSIPLWYDW